jgi:hypothetical protein
MNNPRTHTPRTERPGFWLRAIEVRKHELAREQRRAFRDALADRSREGVSDEDYATTMATLEKMARNLGWQDGDELPRRGFGKPGFGKRGFGPRRGFGHHPHPFREGGPEA